MTTKDNRTLIVRIGRSTLTFIIGEGNAEAISYDMKSGMSVAANLREAFKVLPAINGRWTKGYLLADTQPMPVPDSEYTPADADLLYRHTFSGHERDTILSITVEALHAVVLFAIDKDLQTVMGDHCDEVDYLPTPLPVWRRIGRQGDGNRETLYGYFHDDKMDVFAFRKHRFRFCNSFSATHSHDALFYLLSVFTQLGMKGERDELVLLGSDSHLQWVEEQLKEYVKRSRRMSAGDLGLSDDHLPTDTALLLQQI